VKYRSLTSPQSKTGYSFRGATFFVPMLHFPVEFALRTARRNRTKPEIPISALFLVSQPPLARLCKG
jgi:hypothetical protein